MFDDAQKSERQPLTKAVTVCAVGMGVGFGTCGVGLLVGSDRFTPIVAGAGGIIFFGSLFGLVVIGLIALGRVLLDSFRR